MGSRIVVTRRSKSRIDGSYNMYDVGALQGILRVRVGATRVRSWSYLKVT